MGIIQCFKQKGQTLIEVLVTVLFIGIAAIALVRFQTYLGYDSKLSQQQGEATLVAIQQLETMKDFQVLNNTPGYTSYQSISSGSSSETVNNTVYAVAWTVTSYTNPTYKNLDVSVTWTDEQGNSKSVRLVTDVAGVDPSTAASVM